MASAHKGVFFFKPLLFVTAFISIVAATSFLIKDVFAYSGSEVNTHTTTTAVYQTDLPYFPTYNTSYKPNHVSVMVITEHVDGITYGTTVQDALIDLGIQVKETYMVKPPLDAVVTDGMLIRINEVTLERRVEYEVIPYESVTYEDDTREIDTTTVVQTGSTGQKKVVYEYAYVDGIFTTRTAVREEIIASPQNELVALGTMRVFRPMTIGLDSFSYWKVMRVFATSYDAFCEGCNQWTATGVIVNKGICAVDRTVIPMHSHFYVPGYGFCVAEDVGGAIRGNRIDLGFDDLRLHQGEWSARYVDIYLMD